MSTCPRCAAPLVEIRLAAAATDLVMRSCSRCDGRWWSRDGESADLSAVLGSVAQLSRKAG
jgi:Zn-finger nucleic acid-binding protein